MGIQSKDFSVEENKQFHEKISQINQGSEAFRQNLNGEYMLPIENKIVFTDGNYDAPNISEIVEVLTDSSTVFEDIRRVIFDVERGEQDVHSATRYVQNAFGYECVISYKSGNNGVYGWQDGKRKGTTRRAVIRNYLNQQHGRRNDIEGEKTRLNENAKETLFNVETGKLDKPEAVRVIEQVVGNGSVISYYGGNNGVYGWQDGKRKGTTRRAVIRNYLNQQHGRRNDIEGEKTRLNENAKASSKDGAFSLSQNEDLAPVAPAGTYNVYGKDISPSYFLTQLSSLL